MSRSRFNRLLLTTGDIVAHRSFLLEPDGPFPDWSPADTVVLCPNDVIRGVSRAGQDWLYRFPIIFMGSGQLSYHLQDADFYRNRDSFGRFKASYILCLSELDKLTYAQFGIYDTAILPHPVAQRSVNTYSATSNVRAGYVGRIDFRTRGCDRLVAAAKAVAETRFAPLVVRTTDPAFSVSPDLDQLQQLLAAAGLSDVVRFEFGLVDGSDLYSDLAVLISPGRKESFGLAVLEAMSFGVPVIASDYCPGPRDIIDNGVDGLLVDDWSVPALRDALQTVDAACEAMSDAAFAKHKLFKLEPYLAQLEELAATVLQSFGGTNQLEVFPRLTAVEKLSDRLDISVRDLKSSRQEGNVLRSENANLSKQIANRERKIANRDAKIEELTGLLKETDRRLRRRQPVRLARAVARRLKRALVGAEPPCWRQRLPDCPRVNGGCAALHEQRSRIGSSDPHNCDRSASEGPRRRAANSDTVRWGRARRIVRA